MRILVDEDLASKTLLRALAELEAVDPLPPEQEATDEEVWARAQVEGAVVLAGNARDFVPIAQRQPDHAGLLLVSRLNRPSDLRAIDIAAAVAAVRDAYPQGIAGATLVLNAFVPDSDN